ncbi:MAG: DUF1801 domain-containing protein [Burkholderiales bacterium]|nr:DUF1801 domain-containing protein [Burkholderiales bacterium]
MRARWRLSLGLARANAPEIRGAQLAENETKPTAASVAAPLNATAANPAQRRDAKVLCSLPGQATGESHRKWSPSIVGYGSCHYRYDSRRQRDACLTGSAVRKSAFTVYLVTTTDEQTTRLARLGRHRRGKSCLYIRRREDVDHQVLDALVVKLQ